MISSRRVDLLLTLFCASSVHAWTTFTVPHQVGQDDAPALTSILASGNVSSNATILFKKGVTYNIFTPIKFPVLNNVEVAVEGNLTYPDDIPTVQGAPWYASDVGIAESDTLPLSGGFFVCKSSSQVASHY